MHREDACMRVQLYLAAVDTADDSCRLLKHVKKPR